MGVEIKMIGFHVVDVGAADARHVRHVVATTLADVAKIRVAVPTTDVFDDLGASLAEGHRCSVTRPKRK